MGAEFAAKTAEENMNPQKIQPTGTAAAWQGLRESPSSPRSASSPPDRDNGEPSESRAGWVLLLVFVSLIVGILAIGDRSWRNYEGHYRDNVEREILSVAELKADELLQWRRERLADGTIFYRNSAFTELVRRALSQPPNASAERDLRIWLQKVQSSYGYEQILFLDAKGVSRLTVPADPEPSCSETLRLTSEAMRSGQIAFQDFNRHSENQNLYLAVLVPILDGSNADRPLGVLVLRINPATYLYPFIKRWPTPSSTSETLMLRRERQNVLYLNNLRSQTNAALNLRIPLTRTEVPAVRAILGYRGVMEGVDYRGAPVVAASHEVPDSPWVLIAKTDIAEAYAPLRERFWLTVTTIGALLISAGACVGLVWRQQRARFLKKQHETAMALKMTEEHLDDATKVRRMVEMQLAAIVSSSDDAIIGKDLDGLVTSWNQGAERTFGYTASEMVGSSILRLIPADRRNEEDLILEKIKRGERIDRFETLRRTKDGRLISVSVTSSPIKDANGRIVGASKVARDITELKRVEEQVREKEENYRTLADSGMALIWTSGLDKKCDYFNQPWLKFTGRTLDQELGDGWAEGVHPDDLARCFKIYTEAFERRESFSMDYRLRRHDGEFRWIQDVGTPRHDSRGIFLGYIGHCLDITERMREEEERARLKEQINQARKMESVGQLAGGVAHDFNNLLMVIQGHISLLLKRMPPEAPERNKIEEIRKAANRGAALTRQLLTFGRKQVTQVCRIQINEIVEEILKMIGQILGEDIRVIMECAPHLGLVMMDPGQIQQVLMNLVVNARDAMPGGGTLTIETANVRVPSEASASFVDVPGGDYAMIVVRDTGLGMTPEVQSHLFEPFFTTKERGKGTGLGLAVVYGIVKQAGGYIAVQSEAGKGATFRILLPEVRKTEASIKKALESDKSPVGGTETILLVEDEEALRKVTTEILRSAGYRVIHAGGAEEALRILRDPKVPIRLMLSDVVMPGMQGPDLAAKAQLLRPELKVVLMSGYSEDKIMNQILLESMAFLAKPISDDQLLRKLREVLDGGGGGGVKKSGRRADK